MILNGAHAVIQDILDEVRAEDVVITPESLDSMASELKGLSLTLNTSNSLRAQIDSLRAFAHILSQLQSYIAGTAVTHKGAEKA